MSNAVSDGNDIVPSAPECCSNGNLLVCNIDTGVWEEDNCDQLDGDMCLELQCPAN